MNLKEKINNDVKDAMRAKSTDELSVLRMLLSAIKDREISLRKGEDVALSDEQVLAVIASEVKKRKDSVLAYEQGGRGDLVQKENNEIKILEKYLPEQMSDEELENIVRETIEAQGDVTVKDFGKIMGQIIPKTKGKADGGRISEMVKKLLSK